MFVMRPQEKNDWPKKIKVGSVTVKIYKTPTRGNPGYTIAYHEGARRQRRMFGDLANAKAEAKFVAERLNAGKGAALELTGADRDAYLHAKSKLRHLDVGLVPAIDEYVAAKQWNVPLPAAAKAYHDSHNTKLPEKTISEVYEEMMAARRKEGAGQTYLIDLKSRLSHFARDFKDMIAVVTADNITTWLHSLGLSPRSKRNYQNSIVSLFKFARDEKGYLNRDRKTEAELSRRIKVKSSPGVHFKPQEFASLLSVADDDILPFLCSVVSAGCAPSRLSGSSGKTCTGANLSFTSIGKPPNKGRLGALAAHP